MKRQQISLALAAAMAIVIMVVSGAILALARAANSQSNPPGTKAAPKGSNAATKSTKKSPGYHVVWLVEIVGRADLWVSREGLKIASSTVSFLVDSKTLETIMYNPESKKCKHFKDKKSFERVSIMTTRQYETKRHTDYSKWQKSGQIKLCGQNCDRFTRTVLNCEHDAQYTSSCEEECIIMPLPGAIRVLSMVDSFYHLRDTPRTGIWVQRSDFYQERLVRTKKITYTNKKYWLRTKSIEKVDIDPSIYKLSKGYKEVDDEGDILFGSQMTPQGL